MGRAWSNTRSRAIKLLIAIRSAVYNQLILITTTLNQFLYSEMLTSVLKTQGTRKGGRKAQLEER
jgi:hypothetical protein